MTLNKKVDSRVSGGDEPYVRCCFPWLASEAANEPVNEPASSDRLISSENQLSFDDKLSQLAAESAVSSSSCFAARCVCLWTAGSAVTRPAKKPVACLGDDDTGDISTRSFRFRWQSSMHVEFAPPKDSR